MDISKGLLKGGLLGIVIRAQASALIKGVAETGKETRSVLVQEIGEEETMALIEEMKAIMRQVDDESHGNLIDAMFEAAAIAAVKAVISRE